MSTVYPTAIDTNASLPLVIDGVTPISAVYINQLQQTVIAIEQDLGILPSGTYTTVRARLDAMQASINLLLDGYGGGGGGGGSVIFSGDLIGSSTAQQVVGLRGFPIAPIVPTTGDVLIFNGVEYVPGLSGSFTPGGDLGGTSSSQIVIGIQGTPVSNIAPVAGLPLIYNGTNYAPSGNFLTQNITTTGSVSSGPVIATSLVTGVGTFSGKIVVNAVTISGTPSPTSGQGVIYFDTVTNLFKASQDGGHTYQNLIQNVGVVEVTSGFSFPYTVASTDYFLAVPDGLSRVINLPVAPAIGESIIVKDVAGTAAAHNITIVGNGNSVDGAPSFVMPSNYESTMLVFVSELLGWSIA